ncbi:regulator of G-protein signaling 22-like isoform X3 [Babylonia areolata]|uniref:regulator of G-protein signaling 22-like isoform X3 n=1 Tax=Babylonia areolata TaxID=304850 RepID=UPI003FD4B1B5
MASVVVVQVDPPQVDDDDVEDFLATDDLFVEYFNYYLALPSFPEPLCFNPESGGFEVVSEERRALATQIKAAVRSQRRTPGIYRVAKRHAFIDIPLVPIVPPELPDRMEIDTSFCVTTLNKEQGIHWVKAERLPTFLQSDCYFEYRLGNVLSQVRLMDSKGCFVLTKVDFTPRPRKSRKKQEEVKVDMKDVYMKQMFVCMGQAPTTSTDSWFTQAKQAHLTQPTYISLSRPVSASRPVVSATSRRSAASNRSSRRRPDSGVSGMASPQKSSVFSSPFFGQHDVMTPGDVTAQRLYPSEVGGLKPITPRPSDPVCVTAPPPSEGDPLASSVVYACPPKIESADNESGMGDSSEMSNEDTEADSHSSKKEEEEEGDDDEEEDEKRSTASRQSVVVRSVDDLSAVIVGAVMKRAMADVARIEQSALDKDPRLARVFPDQSYSHISTDMLDNLVAVINPSVHSPVNADAPPPPHSKNNDGGSSKTNHRTKAGGNDNNDDDAGESDVDSMLDSEDDYEERDVKFFRRHRRARSYDLQTRKGIQQFKRFLRGTAGEHLWTLWMDVDKLTLVPPEDQPLYLNNLREKYHKQGSPSEIPAEFKASLELSEPSQWTVSHLLDVQPRIAEPLVLYWAPRFLLKQLLRTNPAKYRQYQEQRLNLMPPREVHPYPPTMTLLPLRPKSCHPNMDDREISVEDLWQQESRTEETLELTTPRVGMRRVHGPPAIKLPAPPPAPTLTTALPSLCRPLSEPARKKPRDFLLTHLKSRGQLSMLDRAGSSVSRSQSKPSSGKSRPKFSKPPSGVLPAVHRSRPRSPGSESSDSWEHGSATSLDRAQRLTSAVTVSTDKRSRPVTAPSERVGSAGSGGEVSQFEGGRRMEALLQALYHEKDSGHFFRSYLKKSNNKKWLDAAQFWEDVQEYRMLFYQESMDPFMVKKHAQAINSKFIVSGCPRNIGCSTQVRRDVFQCLVPPQEELFDQAEEEALGTLYSAWMAGLTADMLTYNKVELIEVTRHLETKNRCVLNLQRSGLLKERPLTPDEPMDGYEDPVYDPAVWEAVPEDFRDFSLEKLVHNRLELEHFKQFLAEKYADTDLKCWMDVEAWRRISPTEERKRDQKAKDIKKSYLNKKYFFGPNSPAGKEGQDKVMQAGGGWGKLLEDRPPNAVLLEAQKYVRERLEQKWLPLFLLTDAFADRQRPKTNMDDVVDDVLVQKRRRSQAVWKMLESKWVSSSKEILTFRKALMNPITSHQFRRFVSIKGDNLENDVLFWQEVQKYKQMHHVHTEDSLLSQKITAIINCFIDSQIPPSLQVDLPQEMADRILDRKYEKSPYLFREAQLTVFRILFAQWNEFCELRMNLGQDKVLPTIERLRRHAKAKERRKQQEMERLESVAGGDGPPLDPFADHESQEEEVDGAGPNKEKVEFSYAGYMKEFDREEILNNTDESIFSSLPELTGAPSTKDVSQPNNDEVPQNTTTTTTTNDNDGKQSSEEAANSGGKKQTKSEQTQTQTSGASQHTSPSRKKNTKQEASKQKAAPEAAASEAGPVTDVTTTSVDVTSRSHHPAASVNLHDAQASEVKLSRRIPPLIRPPKRLTFQ